MYIKLILTFPGTLGWICSAGDQQVPEDKIPAFFDNVSPEGGEAWGVHAIHPGSHLGPCTCRAPAALETPDKPVHGRLPGT